MNKIKQKDILNLFTKYNLVEQAQENVPQDEEQQNQQQDQYVEDPNVEQNEEQMNDEYADQSMDGMEGDPLNDPMSGMPGEEIKSAIDIGKTYELKKIYTRLISVEKFLNEIDEDKLEYLKNYTKKAIELFHILISNFKSYKDNINDIIIMYYKFIDSLYFDLNKYYKSKYNKLNGGK